MKDAKVGGSCGVRRSVSVKFGLGVCGLGDGDRREAGRRTGKFVCCPFWAACRQLCGSPLLRIDGDTGDYFGGGAEAVDAAS
jgi:hypothetical protein